MKAYRDIPSPLFEIYFFFLSLIFIIIYTYPLITDLSGIFFGFPWDSLGGIWSLWWLKFSYIHGLSSKLHIYSAYPVGHDFSNNPFPYLFNFTGFLLIYFTNEVVAYNALKLISFPLLALTTYLLVYYLTGDRIVSAVMGLVYSFSPFHVIHNMAHFANVYWMPLSILFLLKLLREGGYRNGSLFGLFWGLTFMDNAYYAYFVGLLMPIFVIFFLLKYGTKANILKISFLQAIAIGFFAFFLIVFPMMYPMLKGMFFNQSVNVPSSIGLVRDFSDLFIGSAKPLDYFFPSRHNPFLGWLVPDLGMGPLKGHKYTEHTLYLGYSLIFLAGYAFYCAIRKAGQLGRNKECRHMVYLFLAITMAAMILSAPPFIPLGSYIVDFQTREIFAEHKLYLPQYFLYKIFPMFRVYARIGAVVLLAMCILAVFGIREILARVNTPKMRYIILSLFSLIVFVEYAEFPSFRLTIVHEPKVYKWLASQPEQFPIVEYPLGAGDDPYTTYEYYFYQRLHKKYLVNGALKGTPADEFRKEIIDISKPETVYKLSDIGVKYILIHKDKYIKGNETVSLDWLTKPPREKLFPVEYNDGKVPEMPIEKIRLIKDFGDVAVYEPIKNY